MGIFDLLLWALLSVALWAGFRVQALGLANPHLANKSIIGLAVPASVLLLIVAFATTWWLHSFFLALLTSVAAVVTALVLYALGLIFNPILYYVVALACWVGYFYRIASNV